MSMNIEIEGSDEMVRAVMNKFNKDKVAGVVKRNTTQAQRKAMKFAAVDTGHMRRSITMEVQFVGLTGYVTANADYSAYVEYGTRYNDSQPFMRPAAREQAPIFLNDLKNLLRG